MKLVHILEKEGCRPGQKQRLPLTIWSDRESLLAIDIPGSPQVTFHLRPDGKLMLEFTDSESEFQAVGLPILVETRVDESQPAEKALDLIKKALPYVVQAEEEDERERDHWKQYYRKSGRDIDVVEGPVEYEPSLSEAMAKYLKEMKIRCPECQKFAVTWREEKHYVCEKCTWVGDLAGWYVFENLGDPE